VWLDRLDRLSKLHGYLTIRLGKPHFLRSTSILPYFIPPRNQKYPPTPYFYTHKLCPSCQTPRAKHHTLWAGCQLMTQQQILSPVTIRDSLNGLVQRSCATNARIFSNIGGPEIIGRRNGRIIDITLWVICRHLPKPVALCPCV